MIIYLLYACFDLFVNFVYIYPSILCNITVSDFLNQWALNLFSPLSFGQINPAPVCAVFKHKTALVKIVR